MHFALPQTLKLGYGPGLDSPQALFFKSAIWPDR